MRDSITTGSFNSELIETVGLLFVAYTSQNGKNTHLYEYTNTLFTDILSMVMIQLNDVDIPKELSDEIPNVIHYALNTICHKYICPRRSFSESNVSKQSELTKTTVDRVLARLAKIPQPEQRTQAWYSTRYNLITASNAYKCLSTATCSERNSIILEKCKPLVVLDSDDSNRIETNKTNETSSYVNTETALHYGVRYEPLSVMYYEWYYDTQIGEYGCVPHSAHSFLGASPDGINIKRDNDRYGRMLEIKNPKSRKITGIPKTEYWVQMQLQMEACNLNQCDFLETHFTEYDSYHEFLADGSFQQSIDGHNKGVIYHFKHNNKPHYEYLPFNSTQEEYELWDKQVLMKNNDKEWLETIFWKLETVSCVLVERNKQWFNDNIDDIKEVWDTILKERVTGYEHRKPKKRIHTDSFSLLRSTVKQDNQESHVTSPQKVKRTSLFS